MNPVWALFFKDRFRTPFSVYKMSLAEMVVLLSMLVGFGYGVAKGIEAIVSFETAEVVEMTTE